VAWSPTLGYAKVHPEVQAATETAAKRFQDLGCHVELVEHVFDDPDSIWSPFFHGGIAGRYHGYLPSGARAWIPAWSRSSRRVRGSPSWTWARRLRPAGFYERVRKFFLGYDLLLTPTLAVPPFAAGQEQPADQAGGSRLAWVAFTYPFNLTGHPAATIPCGFTRDGLPIGLQIVGRRLGDATVLRASATFEEALPWAGRRPALD